MVAAGTTHDTPAACHPEDHNSPAGAFHGVDELGVQLVGFTAPMSLEVQHALMGFDDPGCQLWAAWVSTEVSIFSGGFIATTLEPLEPANHL